MRWTNEATWNDAVRGASLRYGVEPELIKAIIGQESAFRPTAYRAESAIGDASIGLMQILYGTARGEGYTGPVGSASALTGLYDPATNVMFGTSYLARQLGRTGNIEAAISSYNGGYRPEIGFGQQAIKPVTICLMRDASGKCIRTRNVAVGEFANQPYVNAVMANYSYFRNQATSTVSSPARSGTSPPLTVAHHKRESETGGHSRGTPARITRTQKGAALVTQFLSVASGKKWVTLLGMLLAAIGFLCLQHRADLDAIVSATWAGRLCSTVTALGTVMASLGKGLADRRRTVRPNGAYVASAKGNS